MQAMGSQGVLAFDCLTSTMNGDKFFDFVRGSLIPCMQQFPAPNSMDNCSIYHVQDVKNELQAAAIMLIFCLRIQCFQLRGATIE